MTAPVRNRYAAYVDRMSGTLAEQTDAWLASIFGTVDDARAAAALGWTMTYGRPVLTRERVGTVWWTVLRQQVTVTRGDVRLRHTAEVVVN
jgi:hypothetical protein